MVVSGGWGSVDHYQTHVYMVIHSIFFFVMSRVNLVVMILCVIHMIIKFSLVFGTGSACSELKFITTFIGSLDS